MSITRCSNCGGDYRWSWEEAFDKFGFGDGDGMVMTDTVVQVLSDAGYTAAAAPWSVHNITIGSIKTKKGKELIPSHANLGYDDPRDFLPKRIIRLLDRALPKDGEVMP